VSGRHRPADHVGRPSTLRTPLSIVAVAALVAVTAVAVRVMAADANGCSGGVALSVAAAPDVAAAVEDAGREWMKSNPEVNGKCIRVQVRPVPAADIAGALAVRGGGNIDVAAKPAPTPSEADIPAVWIPDSTAWLSRVSAIDRSALGAAAPSVALSPVVFAMPEAVAAAMAAQLGGAGGNAGAGAEGLLRTALTDWQKAIAERRLPQLPVGLVDPRRDTASLAGAMILRDAVVTDETKVANLIAVYRLVNRFRAPDVATLQKSFAQGVKAAPMAEQSVLAFNGTNPRAPLAAIQLPPGGPALDYPFATLNGKPREVDAAAGKFRTALSGTAYRGSFARRGFRAPDGTAGPGFPTGHGVTAQPVTASALDDAIRVGQTLGLWSAANSPSRALAIIDVTASMAAPLGATTRLDVMQRSAILGLSLFTDTSSLGQWTFAATHAELTPIIPLNEANRNTLNAKIQGIQLSASNQSALFVALRDAYKLMTETFNPEVANRIIIFTDGKSAISPELKNLEQLSKALERIAVVTKPIEVTLIGVGPEADMTELNEIARMTGGVAKQILNPAQIQSVFLSALQD